MTEQRDVMAGGSLQALLDFWLDEFAEDDEGGPLAMAAAVATFTGVAGVTDPVAFAEWLKAEATDTDADEVFEVDAAPAGSGAVSEILPRSLRAKIERRARAKDFETRTFALNEVRVERDGGAPRLVGHAAVFDSRSQDLGGFREVVRRGFFADVLGQDVRALFNHDPNFVLGRTSAGTLRLAEDEHGLAFDTTPPDTQWARDLTVSVGRGDIDQMSFAFRAAEDKWATEDGAMLRELIRASALRDVSIVTYPAYTATDVQARALAAAGLDYEAAARITRRHMRGETLSESDLESLRRHVSALSSVLPSATTQQSRATEGEAAPAQKSRVSALRRRLRTVVSD